MKKIIASGLAAASVVLLSGCSWNMRSNVDTKTDMMPQADNAMMKKEDPVAKSDSEKKVDIMSLEDPNEKVYGYENYSLKGLEESLAAQKDVVLFFYASWCPTCQVADKNFRNENNAWASIIVYKVDFDTNLELRKKYGVVSQHTFVSLNTDGTVKNKMSGAMHFSDLRKL